MKLGGGNLNHFQNLSYNFFVINGNREGHLFHVYSVVFDNDNRELGRRDFDNREGVKDFLIDSGGL